MAANKALPTTGVIIGDSGVRSWNWRSSPAVPKVPIKMIQASGVGILKWVRSVSRPRVWPDACMGRVSRRRCPSLAGS